MTRVDGRHVPRGTAFAVLLSLLKIHFSRSEACRDRCAGPIPAKKDSLAAPLCIVSLFRSYSVPVETEILDGRGERDTQLIRGNCEILSEVSSRPGKNAEIYDIAGNRTVFFGTFVRATVCGRRCARYPKDL